MKNIFQKLSVCVLMHLIDQSGRAMCRVVIETQMPLPSTKLKFKSRKWMWPWSVARGQR